MTGVIGHRGILFAGGGAGFRAAVLAMSPLVYYPMGESSGAVMQALAGSNGAYDGAPTYSRPAIVPGDAATSIGTAAAANRGRFARVLTGSTDFTICLAIRTSKVNAQMLVFDQDVVSGSAPRHFLAINRSGTNISDVLAGAVEVFNFDGGTNRGVRALGADVSDGQPHLIVYGRQGTSAFIDVDGVSQALTGEGMSAGTIFSGTNQGIGQSLATGVLPYVGDVGHFACWNRRLTPAERLELATTAGLI